MRRHNVDQLARRDRRRHLKRSRGRDGVRLALDEMEELLPWRFADVHPRSREHFPVFVHNIIASLTYSLGWLLVIASKRTVR